MYKVIAMPSASTLSVNPDASPLYSWHKNLEDAERAIKECRVRKIYGRVTLIQGEECPDCGGEGRVLYNAFDGTETGYPEEGTCERCGGEGVIFQHVP